MHWSIEQGTYQLAVFPRTRAGATLAPEALEALGTLEELGGYAQVTFEPDAVTVLACEGALRPLLAASPGARVEGDLAWIRFAAPMGWELVGFLAFVTARFAQAGIPLGAVCSFDHDHLFVARRYLPGVRDVLAELFPGRELR